MTIYLDVLYLINCYVTMFLLCSTRYLLQQAVPLWRLCGVALLGGCYGFLFLFELSLAEELFAKMLMLLSLPALAFGWQEFWKKLLSFLVVQVIYAGFLYGWLLLFPSAAMVQNGALYLPVSARFLCLATLLVYTLFWVYAKVHFRVLAEEQIVQTEIDLLNRTISVPTLCDTGHSLFDSISGLPVVLCDPCAFRALVSPSDFTALTSLRPDALSQEMKRRFRLVDTQSVGGRRSLPALRVDGCRVYGKRRMHRRSALVAIPQESFGDTRYQAIAGITFC